MSTTPEAWLGLDRDAIVSRVLDRVRPWVESETPSHDAAAIDALSREIETELIALGATTTATDAPGLGRNLRAAFEGGEARAKPLLVLAHIDTVHPRGSLATMPCEVRDGRATGPGIYDMKSGLALVVEALAWLRANGRRPRRPVRVLVTCDEEIGAHSSRPLFEQGARECAAALVLEPCLPDGSVKTARKGVSTYRLDIEGRAAHAGVEPELAVSATRELITLLPAIQALENTAKGTTLNVGILRAGTATNTVPAHAHLTVDVRAVVPEEATRVDAGLRAIRPAHPEAIYRLERTEHRGPLVRTPEVVALYETARNVAAGLGVDLGEGSTGGGSDGSIVAEYGLPVLDGLGVLGGGAHALDEHIVLDDLPFRLALVAALLETL